MTKKVLDLQILVYYVLVRDPPTWTNLEKESRDIIPVLQASQVNSVRKNATQDTPQEESWLFQVQSPPEGTFFAEFILLFHT